MDDAESVRRTAELVWLLLFLYPLRCRRSCRPLTASLEPTCSAAQEIFPGRASREVVCSEIPRVCYRLGRYDWLRLLRTWGEHKAAVRKFPDPHRAPSHNTEAPPNSLATRSHPNSRRGPCYFPTESELKKHLEARHRSPQRTNETGIFFFLPESWVADEGQHSQRAADALCRPVSFSWRAGDHAGQMPPKKPSRCCSLAASTASPSRRCF